jgi:hypothetical protein
LSNSTWPIEQIPLGARIEATNPRSWDRDESAPEPDEATWSKIGIRVARPSGAVVELEILRPNAWVDAHHLAVGQPLSLTMPEMAFAGEGAITSIDACPPLAAGPGNVVTGRFVTYNARRLAKVTFEGGVTLEGTPQHPVWSLDRNDWVGLGELEPGERVSAHDGAAVVASVHIAFAHEPVYNIEVHGDHVYEVTSLGILVHNDVPDCIRFFEYKAKLKKGVKLSPDELIDYNELARRFDFGDGPWTNPFLEMEQLRKELQMSGRGTKAANGKEYVLSRLDVEGYEPIHGINWDVGHPRQPGVTAQFLRHAEGDSLSIAAKRNMLRGSRAILYVDKAPCPWCYNSFANFAKYFGLDELVVITPDGIFGRYSASIGRFVRETP